MIHRFRCSTRLARSVGMIALAGALALPISGGTAGAAGRTQHFGPYASDSTDSGTCGNDWAADTFDRNYTVDTRQNADGTYTVREQFKNGSFVTMAGASPGACETNPGGTLVAGITGTMQGEFTVIVSGGAFDPSATCAAPCYTADFVAAFFGASASYTIPSYRFEYTAGGQGLAYHTWKNASLDKGGDHGDISNS